MNLGCIILARTNSSRLKNKVLLKIGNTTIIEILIKRLKKIKKIKKIVLATTLKHEDNVLEKIAKKNKIEIYRGHETNVVRRVIDAANKYKIKNILEITADCPLIDIEIVENCIDIFSKNNVDYLNNCNFRSYPDGMDVQIFNIDCLKTTLKKTKKLEELEHVGIYQMRNQKEFRVINLIAPKKFYFPEISLTLDDKKDFLLIKKIYRNLYKKNKIFSLDEILTLIKEKKWHKINSGVERIGTNLKR
jgi:spore coat polysaccharide biosynthesis protein SpsF